MLQQLRPQVAIFLIGLIFLGVFAWLSHQSWPLPGETTRSADILEAREVGYPDAPVRAYKIRWDSNAGFLERTIEVAGETGPPQSGSLTIAFNTDEPDHVRALKRFDPLSLALAGAGSLLVLLGLTRTLQHLLRGHGSGRSY